MRRYLVKSKTFVYCQRLNLIFQACITKSCLLLIMEPGMQVRKRCERIPHLPDDRDTVVGEILTCVPESSNSSDRFAVAKI